MPTDGDDASTEVVGDDFHLHAVEGHAIEVLQGVEFDIAQLESHDSGIVATYFLDITPSFVEVPFRAIEWVVLMSNHDTFFLEFLQS